MPTNLRKFAPLLVLAGVALMPKAPPRRSPPAEGRGAARRAGGGAAPGQDEPVADRSRTGPDEVGAPSRGRDAESPREIPRRGWKDILLRTWSEFRDDQIPLISAGVTFYALLALFPGIGAFVALYGLFADVNDAQRQLRVLSAMLPPGMLDFVGDQMVRISAARPTELSLAFVGGLALSIWSANGAVKAVLAALNIAYEQEEARSFLRKTLVSLAFTLAGLAFAIVAVGVLAAPAAIKPLMGGGAAALFAWISRPLLLAGLGLGLAVLYRFGPSRERVKWRWISWGSGAVLAAWVVMSTLFSLYVSHFGHYDRTYGPLGAVIGFMMWAYLSTQVVLLGAELNSEIEHQTARDTTTGPARPMGQRGAVMADTVGATQGG